jgi:hypothetical protein
MCPPLDRYEKGGRERERERPRATSVGTWLIPLHHVTQMAQAQAYPMPPAVQQPPTQEIPQAPTFLPQAPPGSSSDNTSTGFDDLQARLDALKKK